MIRAAGKKLSEWSERLMPDPFVLAILLTIVTLVLGLLFGQNVADKSFLEGLQWLIYHKKPESGEVGGWLGMFYDMVWMKFAMQMCIVLIMGHALALSSPVQWFIGKIARLTRSPGAAIVLVTLVACAASLIQWGLGAIAGAFMAREVGRTFAREQIPVHYPLLGAAGYAGFLVWHGGLSGSAPLKVAEEGHITGMLEQAGIQSIPSGIDPLPITETLLSPLNLIVIGTLVVVVPLILWAVRPREASEMTTWTPSDSLSGEESDEDEEQTAERSWGVALLEDSRLINVVVAFLLGGALVYYFSVEGVDGWQLDSINWLFLGLGIALHPSPKSYVDAVVDGTKGAAGIILQFPFYFGILGLLTASGLITQIAEFFVSISTAQTFPIFTFLSAGIVNFFVPSGGGQWAVQGPVMMEASVKLGIRPEKVIMALAYGDAWTNMLQPFWALPLLGIMDLRAKDIVGYTALVLVVTGPLMMLLLYLL